MNDFNLVGKSAELFKKWFNENVELLDESGSLIRSNTFEYHHYFLNTPISFKYEILKDFFEVYKIYPDVIHCHKQPFKFVNPFLKGKYLSVCSNTFKTIELIFTNDKDEARISSMVKACEILNERFIIPGTKVNTEITC